MPDSQLFLSEGTVRTVHSREQAALTLSEAGGFIC